ncbi:zinc ribbon domain-containing protein [Caloranaerobacter azorensis]|uniref:Zinc ribbon domain-containing protein n=1 Tax=Caloranaerobacter azorensis TaxID=116090 RepID=A0A6P1YBX3_9FIRM|nr:zinc ribbon domain-containing protein [Caloranaerobacter azorensis]QIB26557.1 zinc ribbon domain-containing protein [Caloranaerobacter azorensis]
MSNKISTKRKITYYIGLLLTIIGFLMFFSAFFIGFTAINEPSFGGASSAFVRVPIGMGLIIAGAILQIIGRKGAAGSGIILDPEKAREDLKPFNTTKGKMINDVVENVDILKNFTEKSSSPIKEVVKIKCRNCGKLNDENAKFCNECGREL